MLGKSRISRFLFAGVVTVSLSAMGVLLTGCPEEPAGFEEPAPLEQEPEDQEPMELPDM